MAVLIESITKTYGTGRGAVKALDDVSISFPAGSFTAVMGPSGSGKSTLLQCAAGLDRPDSGKVSIAGTELSRLGETALTRLRRDRVGFVFQSFNLMPSLTAAQNVELPLRLAGRRADPKAVHAALCRVGLADRARHRPAELSGGQQQRVAIARALVTSPQVLFADEPTGALDTGTSRAVLELMSGLVTERNQTVVMVTHDPVAAVLASASGGNPHQRPERFAAAPYVIQVDPNLRVRDRYGSVDSVPLLTQPDVPAAVITQLPGAIQDRSFFAQVEGAPVTQPALGHGWSSAAFAPYVLTAGGPPRSDDEIVVAGPAAVGSRVSVVTAAGSRPYTIVGTVRPRTGEQPVFFTDAEAARLSPGVDALVTYDAATADRASALSGAHLDVLTGGDRHKADPDAVHDTTDLTGLTTFLGVAALLAAFVAITVTASAFGLSVAQRRRDLALLRTVGATPKQVVRTDAPRRRSLARQVPQAAACSAWRGRRGLRPGL